MKLIITYFYIYNIYIIHSAYIIDIGNANANIIIQNKL